MAVLRCGVKIIYAYVESGIEQFISICISNSLKKTAKRGSPETQSSYFKIGTL
jgi:hypothetical protein